MVSYSQLTEFLSPQSFGKVKIKHKFLGVDHSKQCLQSAVLGPPPCIISASPIICSDTFFAMLTCTRLALPFQSAAFRARSGNGPAAGEVVRSLVEAVRLPCADDQLLRRLN